MGIIRRLLDNYDPNGNLLTLENSSSGLKKEYVYNTADQLLTLKVYQSGTLAKTTSYTYDANGNLTQALETDAQNNTAITNYSYNAANQLITVSKTLNGTSVFSISYDYDANGNRAKKTIGGTTYAYTYENGNIVKEDIATTGSTVTLNYQTNDKGNLIGINTGNSKYYFQFNNRGDTIALTDSTGNIVAKYDYDTWGNVTIVSDTTPEQVATLNPYRYVGKYGVRYDQDTTLYFMSWRDYDSNTTRYMVPDNQSGDENKPFTNNKYLYAEGDPINEIDPDGHFALALPVLYLIPGIGEIAMVATLALASAYVYVSVRDHYYYSQPVSQSTTKAVPITIETTEKQNHKYFNATLKGGGGINIGTPLSMNAARTRVLGGKDVYTRLNGDAKSLAIFASGGYVGPEVHRWSPKNKYHYHLRGRIGGHIFFN